jgi:hypothetical protein
LFGENGIEFERLFAVILCKQAMHVHPAAPDRELAGGDLDAETIRRLLRHDAPADDVHRFGSPSAIEKRDQLIPVGVELHAALLH